MTEPADHSWRFVRQLEERHLESIYRREYTCTIPGQRPLASHLGVLERDRTLCLACEAGRLEIAISSPRDRSNLDAFLRSRAMATIALLDAPDHLGFARLTVYGSASDVAVGTPVRMTALPSPPVPGVCGTLEVQGREFGASRKLKFGLQWLSGAESGESQVGVRFRELLSAEEHRRAKGRCPSVAFTIVGDERGEALHQRYESVSPDTAEGGWRLVEFRDAEAVGDLRGLRTVRASFLEEWVQYELACERWRNQEYAERMVAPLRTTARLTMDGGEPYHRYSVMLDHDSRRAWIPSGSLRPTEVTCVSDAGDSRKTGGVRATLMALSQDAAGGVAQLEFREGLPDSPAFFIRPVPSEADQRQRDRKMDSYRAICLGSGVAASVRKALLDPESVTNSPISEIRFPVLTRPTVAQADSVRKALGDSPLVLIQGPPGTGKTDVICQIVAEYVDRRARERIGPPRIALTAQQHTAIDNLVQRLSSRANIQVFRVPSGNDHARFQEQDRVEWERKIEELRDAWLSDESSALSRIFRIRCLESELDACGSSVARELNEQPATQHVDRIYNDALRLQIGVSTPPGVATTLRPSPVAAIKAAAAGVTARDAAMIQAYVEEIGDEELQALWAMLGDMPSGRPSRRLDSAWEAIGERLARLGSEVPAEPQAVALPVDLSAWILEARLAMETCRSRLEQLFPIEAVKASLLHALQAEPKSWTECRQAHASSIAGTCQATLLEDEVLAFDLAIVDEAAQVGMDVLIPIAKSAKVVLVGDHRQLPPYVESEVYRSGAPGGQKSIPSLFESLWSRLPQAAKEVLPMQFRMHPAIGRVVSEAFYEPEVVLRHHDGERGPRLGLFGDCPVVWIDTGSAIPPEMNVSEERTHETSRLELELVVRMLGAIARRSGLRPLELGIACMYSKQRDAVQQILQSTQYDSLRPSIRCDTTDSFQGQEFEHVVVLCSRRGTGPGFLRAPSRLNVALSRARRQVMIFADRSLAKEAPASLAKVELAMSRHGSECRFLTLTEAIRAIQ